MPPPKRVPQTDAIFDQLKEVNPQADRARDTLRVSIDAKATVKVGPFSRRGRSRTGTKAADHDFKPEATLTPFGIFLPEHDDLWPNAVDEVLRFDPPVFLTGRMTMADTEIVGVPMRRGSVLVGLLAGANRDPQVFRQPETFDVSRDNASEHVSFSAGRHYCLGAQLARMEGEIGLRSFFERFPDLRVALLEGKRVTVELVDGTWGKLLLAETSATPAVD